MQYARNGREDGRITSRWSMGVLLKAANKLRDNWQQLYLFLSLVRRQLQNPRVPIAVTSTQLVTMAAAGNYTEAIGLLYGLASLASDLAFLCPVEVDDDQGKLWVFIDLSLIVNTDPRLRWLKEELTWMLTHWCPQFHDVTYPELALFFTLRALRSGRPHRPSIVVTALDLAEEAKLSPGEVQRALGILQGRQVIRVSSNAAFIRISFINQ